MKHADIKAMMAEIAPVIREFTASALGPVVERLDALEKRLADMPLPKDGKDADEEAVAARVAEKMVGELAEIRAAVEAILPAPELPDVAGMIAEALEHERASASVQMQAWAETIRGEIEALPVPQDGKDGRDGKDGTSVIVEDVLPALEKQVADFLATIPMPKDGEPGPKGDPGRDGKDGCDGLDVKDLFRADGGRLVAVMSDGTTKDLGIFVGKDGEPGRDGLDGVGFDDMLFEVRGDGCYLVFEKGGIVKEARLPIPMDRGVYKADETYLRGHCVTWGGGMWIAQKDEPQGKPDAPGSDWRLCVKRGQNGKDAAGARDTGPVKA